MLDELYENIGEKIKSWAKWIFVVEAIGAVIGAIVLIVNDSVLLGLLTLVLGPFAAWVGSWLLYAFGEMVETICSIFCELNELKGIVKGKGAESPTIHANKGNDTATQAKVPLVAGGWVCVCGRTHMPYETSCVCGKTKAEAKIKR